MKDREIEVKLILEDTSLLWVEEVLDDLLDVPSKSGTSEDIYWGLSEAPGHFVRLRECGDKRELTVKRQDRGSTLNRLEINVDITSYMGDVAALMNECHGSPTGFLSKEYVIWPIDTGYISCYQVTIAGKRNPLVFLEIECLTENEALGWERNILYIFRNSKVHRADSSLYDLLLRGAK